MSQAHTFIPDVHVPSQQIRTVLWMSFYVNWYSREKHTMMDCCMEGGGCDCAASAVCIRVDLNSERDRLVLHHCEQSARCRS